MPLGQEGAHLVGFQETGQPQVVEFVLRGGFGVHPEGLGVEQHVVEGGLGFEGLELAQEVIGGRFFAVGHIDEGLRLRPDVGFPGAGTSQHVVALPLQRRGVGQQDRHGGQEHRRHLAAPP